MGPILFRFLSSYFDFGLAYWPMPNREKGMWQCFCEMYSKSGFLSTKFLKTLRRTISVAKWYQYDEAIAFLLQRLAIPEEHMDDYMFRTLYRYKGWTGTIKSLEGMPEWIPKHDIKAAFKEVIPVILVLELAAIESLCDIRGLKVPVYKPEPLYDPYFVASIVSALGVINGGTFPKEVTQFTDENRQEIWQCAYEDTFYNQFLSAYKKCAIEAKPKYKLPDYQVFTCIDEREESFRRHLEQIDPGVETLSAAGHFALDMRFKGAVDKHYRKMCPHPLVTPSAQIYEEVVKLDDAMPKKLQIYGEVQWAITQSSKTLLGSFVHTTFSGLLNFLPYILDVLSPKYSSRLRRYLAAHEPKTRLVYKKENKENEKGWDLQGRIARATAILKGAGFSDNFSPYVFVLGHGSSSLNNPHEAAHDCGACAGGRGAPNARLFAAICNEPEVRAGLAKNGIIIPDYTRFIGGYHNTCSDEVLLFDLPDPIEPRLQKYIDSIRRAAALDAKERCRRFDEVKTDLSEKAFADYARLEDIRQAVGKTDFDLWPKELAEKYRADDAEVMAMRQQKHVEEVAFDGSKEHWVETFKTPVIGENGNVLGTTGFAHDVTERREFEEELKRSNIELEQFSYAISHDMRQPLRMISSYLQLIEKSVAGQLDSEKRGYFGFAIEGAKRIDQMLVALLEYSRVGRMGESPDWIESRAVLDEALQFLQPAIAEAQAKVSIVGEWPRILASHDEMLRLIQNLIGNAAKYRIAGRIPEITVTSGAVKNEWHLCVADNGVGIIPGQAKRLFQVFQRLQSREAYEGTGIGLALCRKIAERHKGRIWAESVGEGQGKLKALPGAAAPQTPKPADTGAAPAGGEKAEEDLFKGFDFGQ